MANLRGFFAHGATTDYHRKDWLLLSLLYRPFSALRDGDDEK